MWLPLAVAGALFLHGKRKRERLRSAGPAAGAEQGRRRVCRAEEEMVLAEQARMMKKDGRDERSRMPQWGPSTAAEVRAAPELRPPPAAVTL